MEQKSFNLGIVKLLNFFENGIIFRYNIIEINFLSRKAKWVFKVWLKHDEILKHRGIQLFENSKLSKFKRKYPSICFKDSLINSSVKFELRGVINHRCYKNQ